ncbi:MAG: hypothetical protein CM15mP128_0690 [Methanobacteriota archaeon]|nr:MAG: hypothetical protein CM15mP128_0690 [Euryarchaeota archaeon]
MGLGVAAGAWVNVERGSIAPMPRQRWGQPPKNSTSFGCLTPGCSVQKFSPFISKPSAKATVSGNSARGGEPISCSSRKGASCCWPAWPVAAFPNHGQAHPRLMFIPGCHPFSLSRCPRLAPPPGAGILGRFGRGGPLFPPTRPGSSKFWVAFMGPMMLMLGPKNFRESEFAEVQQSRRAKVNENRNAFIQTHRSSSSQGHSRLARGPTRPMRTRSSPLVRATCPGTAKGAGGSVAMGLGGRDGETHAIPQRWPRRRKFKCLKFPRSR